MAIPCSSQDRYFDDRHLVYDSVGEQNRVRFNVRHHLLGTVMLFEKFIPKEWPDFVLVVAVGVLLLIVPHLFAGHRLAPGMAFLATGTFVFGLAGKLSFYKYRDPSVIGNTNAWFSGWRHSWIGNIFALIGITLIALGIFILIRPLSCL